MSWVFFALAGYFLQSLAALGDKIILGKILPRPASYAFWQGVLSLGVLAFLPFGFSLLPAREIFLNFLAGIFWLWGLFLFYHALRLSEASKVVPVVLSFAPLFLFGFESFFLDEAFSFQEVLGAVFLIFGGIFLSLELENKKEYSFLKLFIFSLLAALLFSFSLFLMRALFLRESFINVLIWSRLGLFLGAFTFFILPVWRKEISNSFGRVKSPRGGIPLVGVKLLGAFGALSIFFAISRGPATLVQALQGIEYAFLFLAAFFLSFFAPWLIAERFTPQTFLQKFGGILLVSIGIFLLFI